MLTIGLKSVFPRESTFSARISSQYLRVCKPEYTRIKLGGVIKQVNKHRRCVLRVNGVSQQTQESNKGSVNTGTVGLLVSIQLSFAIYYVLGGQVLGHADPLTFALVREIAASGILVYLAKKVDGPVKLQKAEDIMHFGVLGFLCFGCIAGFTSALSLVSDFNAALATPLVPVAALMFSVLEGQERLSWKAGAGVIMSVLGSILVVSSQSSGDQVGLSGNAILGNMFLALAILSYGYLYVYMGRVKDRYPSFTLTSWYYIVCSVLCFFFCLQSQGWNFDLLVQDIEAFDLKTWGVLTYAIIFATVYNFSASTYANQRMPASLVSSYGTLQPFFVAMIGMVFLGTQVTNMEVGAAGVIVTGLYLCVTSDRQVEATVNEEVGMVKGMWQQVVGVLAGGGNLEWDEVLVRLGLKKKDKELSWIEQRLTDWGWLEVEEEQDRVFANFLPVLDNQSE